MSIDTIRQAVQAEIDKLQKILVLLGTGESTNNRAVSRAPAVKPRRKWSAASRRKMALAQKARWAKIRAAKK